MGPPAASSRWTARPSPTCARPDVRTNSAPVWKPIAGSNPCSGKRAQRIPSTPGWWSSTWPMCGPAWPVPGARRSGCCSRRCPRGSTRACPRWLRDRAEVTMAKAEIAGKRELIHDGDVVIASITSCTNTSNPALMLAAGLLARKAAALGLKPKPWVRTSLAPGLPGRHRLSGRRRAARTAGGPGLRRRAATAAPPASATAGRSPTTCRGPSRTTGWWWPRCSAATGTSRRASTRWCGPTTWRRRRWWWRSPSPGRWTSTWSSEPAGHPGRRAAGLSGRPVAVARGGGRAGRQGAAARTCSGRSTPPLSRAPWPGGNWPCRPAPSTGGTRTPPTCRNRRSSRASPPAAAPRTRGPGRDHAAAASSPSWATR